MFLRLTKLTQAILENDRRAVIQRNGVNVSAACWQVPCRDVEDPLLAIPPESGVRVVRVNYILNDRCGRTRYNGRQEETRHHAGRSDRHSIRVKHREFRGDRPALLE